MIKLKNNLKGWGSMFNKKVLVITALLLVIFMVLVACSSQQTDTGTEPVESTEEGKANEEVAEEDKSTSSLRPEGVPEDFPNKEITYIYPFGPGSIQDAYIRILFEKAKEMEGWKHGLVINYMEGASGKIAWNALANAQPDGYTIGFTPSAMLVPSVAEADEVDFGYDKYDYVFNMMSDPGAIGVAIDSEYETLQDLVEAAKQNPGKITVGVTSTVGQEGLTMAMLEMETGADFNVVAFESEAEIMAGVIGGHLDAFCLNVGDTMTFVENNQIKVLATGDDERSQFLPDVPTYKESGYNVRQVNMRAVGGPKGMPEPIRQYLENVLIAASQHPDVIKQVEELKIPVDTLTGEEVKERFGEIYQSLLDLWEVSPWQ